MCVSGENKENLARALKYSLGKEAIYKALELIIYMGVLCKIYSDFADKLTLDTSEFRKLSVCEWYGVVRTKFSMRLNSRLIMDGRTRTLNVVRVGDVRLRAV